MLNKDKLKKLNLPFIQAKAKVLIWEVETPVSVPGIVEFNYLNQYSSPSIHGFYAAQIIHQVAGGEIELHATTVMNDSVISYCLENGIRIINASISIPSARRSEIEPCLKRFYEAGGVIIASAGNKPGRPVSYPGNSPYTICVSALNYPSSEGPEIDVFSDSWWQVLKPDCSIDVFDGTSCACPVITGCVLKILQRYPSWDTEKIRKFLVNNSNELFFSFPNDFGKEVEKVQKTNIVIHHSATKDGVLKDFDSIRKYHIEVNGWKDIGYHWVVERVNGILRAFPGRAENQKGAHCPEYLMNSTGIGICVVGDFSQSPPDDETYWFVAQLCRDIMSRHPIINIKGHGFYSNTECPGAMFDIERLNRIIRGEEALKDKDKQEVSEWAKDARDWCMKVGITDGTDPKGNITREQVWTMIYRAFMKK